MVKKKKPKALNGVVIHILVVKIPQNPGQVNNRACEEIKIWADVTENILEIFVLTFAKAKAECKSLLICRLFFKYFSHHWERKLNQTTHRPHFRIFIKKKIFHYRRSIKKEFCFVFNLEEIELGLFAKIKTWGAIWRPFFFFF